MTKLLGLTLAATAAFSIAAHAAPERERVRGTVSSITASAVMVHTTAGADLSMAIGADTKYLKVQRASLDKIEEGSYIGTATKDVGEKLVALEVVLFPPAMKGTGDGHYGWDKVPDTTLSGGASTSSTMTNGSVAAVTPAGGGASVNSTMTNGSVASASSKGGAKLLKVTYKGGEQTIIVPPTAPIVTFAPGAMADVKAGSVVFVNASKDDGKYTANAVIVGSDGVNPPM